LPAFFVSTPGDFSSLKLSPGTLPGLFFPPPDGNARLGRRLATRTRAACRSGVRWQWGMAPLACTTVAYPGPSAIQTCRGVLVPLSGSSSMIFASKGCSSALGLARRDRWTARPCAQKEPPRRNAGGEVWSWGNSHRSGPQCRCCFPQISPARIDLDQLGHQVVRNPNNLAMASRSPRSPPRYRPRGVGIRPHAAPYAGQGVRRASRLGIKAVVGSSAGHCGAGRTEAW
jgi:hypothetical protein